jgi:5-methylcytosine-specific restriction endonuclease McrA
MKLTTLKPRLATIPGRLQMAATLSTQRLRGRAAVERRKRWLDLHPLCVECEKEGKTTAGTVPDHVVALVNGGPDTEENLQTLCDEHHRIKTAKDLGYRPKPTIGPDGWPIG